VVLEYLNDLLICHDRHGSRDSAESSANSVRRLFALALAKREKITSFPPTRSIPRPNPKGRPLLALVCLFLC